MKRNNRTNLITVMLVLSVMIAMTVVLFASAGTQASGAADASARAKNQELCSFLLLGTDDAAGLTDVIMLVSVNLESGEISIMQIPRDTYFECGAAYKKLNGAKNTLKSASALSDALSSAMGIRIDYYLSIGLDGVKQMVDAVGGIELDIPFDMDYEDKSQNLAIHLKAGRQTLDGDAALEFLRYRAGYVTGDLGRINAQKLFMNAFVKRVGEMGNPLALYNLCRLVLKSSETNIREADIFTLCLKYAKCKKASVSYMTAPGEAVYGEKSGSWYYILSHDAAAELLKARFGLFEDGKEFDKYKKFVDTNEKSLCEIYEKYCEIKIYSADEIENNEVNIN